MIMAFQKLGPNTKPEEISEALTQALAKSGRPIGEYLRQLAKNAGEK